MKDAEILQLKAQCISNKRPLPNLASKRGVRNATKKLKRTLQVEFDIHSNFDSSHNQGVLQRVVDGALSLDKPEEPISETEAKEAAKRHFKSMKQKSGRQSNGTDKKHNKQARRNSRMAQKKKFWIGGLNHHACPLNSEQKARAGLIMVSECMSSDEDETSTDDQGRECRIVREIPWESDEMKYYKSVTWNHYVERVMERRDAKRVQGLRRDGLTFSDRRCPDPAKMPGWAVKLE